MGLNKRTTLKFGSANIESFFIAKIKSKKYFFQRYSGRSGIGRTERGLNHRHANKMRLYCQKLIGFSTFVDCRTLFHIKQLT